MGLSEFLLSRVDTPLGRRLLRAVNHLRLPRPLPVRVRRQKVYAATIDRVLALLLTKLGRAERFELDLWLRYLRPGMVVADVGANLGLYTLLAARAVGPTGRVHSFEPDAENFALLRRNVAANGHANVVLHEAAVADADGVVSLFRCEEHRGDHRIYPGGDRERAAVPVRVATLDRIFADAPRLDLVKMDIQGSEGRAFDGMRRLMEVNPGLMVFCEFWPKGLRECGSDPEGLVAEFRRRGYRVLHIADARRELEELSDRDLIAAAEGHGYTNLLLTRSAA